MFLTTNAVKDITVGKESCGFFVLYWKGGGFVSEWLIKAGLEKITTLCYRKFGRLALVLHYQLQP